MPLSTVNEITTFLKYKWKNDKNNFLKHSQDFLILHKLSQKEEQSVVGLYTKFIY